MMEKEVGIERFINLIVMVFIISMIFLFFVLVWGLIS